MEMVNVVRAVNMLDSDQIYVKSESEFKSHQKNFYSNPIIIQILRILLHSNLIQPEFFFSKIQIQIDNQPLCPSLP